MRSFKKIFFALLCGGYFFMNFFSVSAFLGEDLGIELYKQIDEGLYELEQKQYEYELTGQGETSVSEVVNPILREQGVECEINSSQDIEAMLGNTAESQVSAIINRCSGDNEVVPTALVERVMNQLQYVRNTFSERAANKAQRTYELARVGLYSDGIIENSPFDLIYDLQEIDYIIFGEELTYEGVPYEKSADEVLDDFLNEDKEYLYDDEDTGTGEIDTGTGGTDTGTGSIIEEPITETPPGEHNYICPLDEDSSGLDDDDINDIIEDIEGGGTGTGHYTPHPHIWVYPGGEVGNGTSWGGPFPPIGGTEVYANVRDDWKCSKFFCIIIEFQKSSYGLAGGETRSIKKVLSKVAEHLEKPANASLTQRKMTTNNFELGSIIRNLPDMLRGFGIEVQSKPIPILDVESDNEDAIQGDIYEVENLLRTYYKNNGMDYDRRNDLDIFGRQAEEAKVFETAGGMPITYPEARMNELARFNQALAENNRTISRSIDSEISQNELTDFAKQFTELEKFVTAMKDFAKAITGVVGEMNKIPTRSS